MTQARGGDVRALVGAILLGSGAGALLGGAYLVATPAPGAGSRQARPAVSAPAAPQAVAAAPAAPPQTLRERFRFIPPPVAARPFRFAAIAGAASDLNCLTEAVYFEARGEPVAGQKAVAQVVLNRVRHPAFPKTVCGVVRQRTASDCQFSFVCDGGEARHDPVAWRRAQSVASGALHGAVMAEVGDATNFQTARSGPFSGLLKVAQIGAHVFYRFAGRAGAGAMFHQHPSPSTPPEEPRSEQPRMVLASLSFTPPPTGLQAKSQMALTVQGPTAPKLAAANLSTTPPSTTTSSLAKTSLAVAAAKPVVAQGRVGATVSAGSSAPAASASPSAKPLAPPASANPGPATAAMAS